MNDHLIKELRRECAFAGSAGVLHLPVTVVEALLYLADANLDLDQVEEATAGRWRILPDDGSVIGWKKCRFDVVVCLEIPHGARRSNAPGSRKCRADTATVIGVWGPGGEPHDSATSLYDEAFRYRPGETVTVDDFNENPLIECGAGIHFYLTRAEAEAHK